MRIHPVLSAIIMLAFSLECYCQHNHPHSDQDARLLDKEKDRWLWQLPRKVINEIGITEGMVVADLGAGTGYFSIPLAQKVGTTGLVYASDIDSNALAVLKMKSGRLRVNNLRIILCTEDNPQLPTGQCDMVVIVNTIHLINDLNSVLGHVKKSLKQHGKMIIIQWDSEKMEVEPESDWDAADKSKYSLQTTLRRIYAANYEVERILTFLPVQNIFICVPKGM